ncbi:hypothetical protein LP417_35460 (plasmid) [Polaromonas sp. P1-6]|nr:hypothetical protein LP417_35460 [Polaromonas sp. P1-6]
MIEKPADLQELPSSLDSDPFSWMFRESSFDPVSRVRRGLLFQKMGNSGWESISVEAHPASSSDQQQRGVGAQRIRKDLSIYCECSNLLNTPGKGEGMRLAIGARDGYSLWKIIQTERTVNSDVLVTLRAESVYGILPALDKSKISPVHLHKVEAALSRVLDAAYRELPTSVVDQCRNAVCVVVTRWAQISTEDEKRQHPDLGQLIKTVQSRHPEKMALHSALDVVNRLHPRGKDNEVERLALRPVHDGDAELAVHAVGFVLREVGWALD